MKITFKKRDLYTIPNILSYIRLLLIPVIFYLYTTAKDASDYYVATILFAICAATDMVDGYVARRFNQITDLGKILDPIADKLMQATVLVCLMLRIDRLIPVFILFAIKELFMGVAGIAFLNTGADFDGAKWFGKICTIILDVAMVVLFAFPNLNSGFTNLLIDLMVVFLLFSLAMYIYDYFLFFRNHRKSK